MIGTTDFVAWVLSSLVVCTLWAFYAHMRAKNPELRVIDDEQSFWMMAGGGGSPYVGFAFPGPALWMITAIITACAWIQNIKSDSDAANVNGLWLLTAVLMIVVYAISYNVTYKHKSEKHVSNTE